MKHFDTFIFSSYDFNADSKKATFRYSFDNEFVFEESFVFDFEFIDYDAPALDRAMQNLFFMAGISYYKMYPSDSIAINQGQLDQQDATFFAEVYQKGLGEFFYVNDLSPNTVVPFEQNTIEQTQKDLSDKEPSGQLIGIGGGKDSLLTAEYLRELPDTKTWSLGHKQQLQKLVEAIGLPHFYVHRTLDPSIQKHNDQGARNGHIPISAVIAMCGTVVAILSGKSDVVTSNEYSANEPTLTYRGTPINHQYSKSQDFEELYQDLLRRQFAGPLNFYSFLRPMSELFIVEKFIAEGLFDKYAGSFSSCNRAFRQNSNALSWCGECPKCAFSYLAFSAFIDNDKLRQLFDRDLLSDERLHKTYEQLLGIHGDKPLECVGEVKESQSALQLAQKTRIDLNQFEVTLPEDYDYRDIHPDSMPEHIRGILLSKLY